MGQSTIKGLLNIGHATLNPSKAAVMINKVSRRFFDRRGSLTDSQYQAWLRQNATPTEAYLEQFDAALLQETADYAASLEQSAAKILAGIPYDLGGGGGVPLLYLVTRLRKPKVVVETGVASGYSSATFLAALQKNGGGKLYSSDFPYFRLPNPERYIGIVVDDSLKQNWALLLNGDETNLRAIVAQSGPIDLFHYDSDKSYQGRTNAMRLIQPKLAPDALVIMDDIQDNCYFHDFVQGKPAGSWKVLAYKDKYIGLYGVL